MNTGGALYRRVTTLMAGGQLTVRQNKAIDQATIASHLVYTEYRQTTRLRAALLFGPPPRGALNVAPRPSVRPSRASDFIEKGKS